MENDQADEYGDKEEVQSKGSDADQDAHLEKSRTKSSDNS